MSQQQHPVSEFTDSALSGLRSLVDVNTVIGDPITAADGTVIIPVSKVAFGYASGGSDWPTSRPDVFGGGTGGGVTISPVAFLVLRGSDVEILSMPQPADNTADRIVNAVPGIIDKVLKSKKNGEKE
ncbi:MAG: sporulation protein YtfJ [Oscillospiraceae bacterium]|nr:sporulation protein YtfJ [Oscillospiraceae bacterium]